MDVMKSGSLESFARSVVDNVVSAIALQDLCAVHSVGMLALLDQLAGHIARGYSTDVWSFADADAAMNHLWAFLCSQKDFEIPSYFYSVYEAFDAGEYCHSGGAQDVSPEERYTKPLIEAILGSS
ncbi:hypothetical protein [Solimonas marina]|uniref:Uncharacterized protein n=1 Tax=Solimonas marina TaxID=2714601 RepID=A0A969WDQ5_9GAMM|nr:hypothetical protein [Solimonas marina]NKF24108.1 hypothetical protein [Solimonas marina]